MSGNGFLCDWLDQGGASTFGPRNPALTGDGGLKNASSGTLGDMPPTRVLLAGDVGSEFCLAIVFLFVHSFETGRGPKLGYLVWGMADCCGGRPWTNSIYPFLGSPVPVGVLTREEPDMSCGVGARFGGLGLLYDTSAALRGIPSH